MTRSPVVLFAFVGLAAVVGTFIGCGDSAEDSSCVGGVVVDGVCEGKCTPDACLPGNVCSGNRCVLECTSHNECFGKFRGDEKTQGCEEVTLDSDSGLNDGEKAFVCVDLVKANNFLKACPIGNECDNPDKADDWACPDGSACTEGEGSDLCTAAECRPLVCVGKGQGDAEAYCTTTDCVTGEDDATCGHGLYCGLTRVSNKICGTDKGTADPCIDPADFAKDGATYQEGPLTLMRNICFKREPCAPCSDKADCSLRSDMECVDLGGEKVCAKTCTSDNDCSNDFRCVEQGFCVPRSGSCTPPPEDNFCHFCLDDLDCGGPGSTMGCADSISTALVSGQRACFDFGFTTQCTSDAQCPTSPSDKPGQCLDAGEGLSPGDDLYQRCYLPFWSTTSSYECWRP